MPFTLRFFRKSSSPKTDYSKVLEYFDEVPNISIYYTGNDVKIEYVDSDFDFAYSFFITKKSYVEQISNISADYSNDNFFLVVPLMLPTYLVTEVLTFAQKIAKQFNLFVYHESFSDVTAFNLVELRELFFTLRAKEIEENGIGEKFLLNGEILNHICIYQRSIEHLREQKEEYKIEKVSVCQNEQTGEYGMLYRFELGCATIFPPHINFIEVKEQDGVSFMVKREDFYKILDANLIRVDNLLPDMYLLRPRKAKKTLKLVNKLRKVSIQMGYKEYPVCYLIDKGE